MVNKHFRPIVNNRTHTFGVSALDKMGIIYDWPIGKYDPDTIDAVFDIASLVLYGTQAIPFRLHVCLYRLLLFSTLQKEEARVGIAGMLGWSWNDVIRGYKLDVS